MMLRDASGVTTACSVFSNVTWALSMDHEKPIERTSCPQAVGVNAAHLAALLARLHALDDVPESSRRSAASPSLSILRSAMAIIASYSRPSGSRMATPLRSRNTTAASRPVRLFPIDERLVLGDVKGVRRRHREHVLVSKCATRNSIPGAST